MDGGGRKDSVRCEVEAAKAEVSGGGGCCCEHGGGFGGVGGGGGCG